jgi:hypothetical protein
MAKNQTIQHKRSTISGNKPTTAQVSTGELALNFADKSIYTKDASNNIIELAREVTKSATQPASPLLGDIWFDTVNNVYKNFNGAGWTKIEYSGLTALPANTTSSVPLTGAGTSGSPYAITVTYTSGTTQLVTTITITGLAPGQLVPITDSNAATNGSRFYTTNNVADDTGVLKFNIMFTDSPATTGSANYTANLVIGTATVYLTVQADKASSFPQAINSPTDTASTSTSWSAAADTITATGSLLVSTDNSTFSTGPLAITTGATLYTKWAGAAGSGTGIDGAHGSVVTGGLTSSSGATSSSSLTISKNPTAVTFTAQTGIGLSTAVDSNSVTIAGVNSYVYLTSSNTMKASVAGATFVSVPASGTTLYAVNGQALAVQQTSSASSNTPTTVTINLNSTTASFTVTTTASGTVNTPAITSPINAANGISKNLTVTSSAFATTGPAGTHLSSDWDIATDSGFATIVAFLNASTTNLTTWTPTGLSASTSYYVRVRYNSTTSVTSSYSTTVSFTTAAIPGDTWTAQPGLSSTGYGATDVKGIIWNGATFLAFGGGTFASGYGATSPDGVTWTNSTLSGQIFNATVRGAAWDGGKFCIVTSTSKSLTSTDGVTWTMGDTSLSTAVSTNTPFGIAWSGTKFCVVGGTAAVGIATSSDGLTWSSAGNNLSASGWGASGVYDIVWSGTKFCAVGYDGKGATSSDGVNWTYQPGLASIWTGAYLITSVVWALGKFWAAGGNGQLASSPDGVTWTLLTGLSSTTWGTTAVSKMIWDGTQFCAVGINGKCATSLDGITWTYRTSLPSFTAAWDITKTINAVASTGAKLIIGGTSGKVATSP